MSHNPGSIGNAVRELAPGATFRVHNDGLIIDDLEWLDDEIDRPTDEEIEAVATQLDNETSGERSASDNVEEEGSPNDPIPDSGSAPSPS